MRRALIIATREYLSFLRTPGFWISLMVAPLVGAMTGLGPMLIARSEPPPVVAVLDLTGRGETGPGPVLIKALSTPQKAGPASRFGPTPQGRPGAVVVPTPPDLAAARTPEQAGQIVRPYMTGARSLSDGRALSALVVIAGDAATRLKVDLWTPSPTVGGLSAQIDGPLDGWVRRTRLTAAGLDPALADSLDKNLTEVRDFSPKAAKGRVSLRDRLPTLAAVALSFLLWMLVMTGAGILLNTVIEEKSNRVMEVLLSSASVSEILSGKILGGAALSLTMMGFWGGIGIWLISRASPDLLAGAVGALLGHGLIFWFAAFFLVGYLMYSSVFAAVGSFCETPREAQTLLGPIMLLLSVPIIFLGASITHPDAPVLKLLVWFPLFTPFLMTLRVAAGASLTELCGGLGMMVATAALVVWLSGRAFRSGALATEKIDPRRMLAGLFRRKVA